MGTSDDVRRLVVGLGNLQEIAWVFRAGMIRAGVRVVGSVI
jgi:hypothetical protein